MASMDRVDTRGNLADQELLELLKEPPAPTPQSALMDKILASYSKQAREGLELALANPAWRTADLRRVVQKHHPISETSFRRYRKDRYGL